MSPINRVSPKWGRTGSSTWRLTNQIYFYGFSAMGLRKFQCKGIGLWYSEFEEILHGCRIWRDWSDNGYMISCCQVHASRDVRVVLESKAPR